MNTMKFAGFIMTYERAETLIETIEILFAQTVPLEKILIVDNSASDNTLNRIALLNDPRVVYHRVGYNSGPAGAAGIGLNTLAVEGYEWIAWMDDDDPPIFKDVFETLLRTAKSNEKCGCVGVVGQYFNKKNGLMVRVPDAAIEGVGSIEVDTIAGGMCKIVNAKVCSISNVFPDEELFFGFEELDFDLRMQEAGYTLLVDKELYKRHRVKFNRVGLNVKKGLKKDQSRLYREYYSTRNSLIIFQKHRLYSALLITFFRSIAKIILGFRFGVKYGWNNMNFVVRAWFHFMISKKGKVDFLN